MTERVACCGRRRLRILGVMGGVLALGAVAFFAIGGTYGIAAIVFGRNPFLLTPPTRGKVEESRRRGDEIIAAMSRYREEKGEYPEDLAELVPEYLVELRQPLVGPRRWGYVRDEEKGFVLSFFMGPMYETWWYEGKAGEWQVDM